MDENKILWLALNAKYSHTSLAIRYLREACRGLGKQELLELTINHQLLDILGQVYKSRPDILSISCYIWNIELVKQLLPISPVCRRTMWVPASSTLRPTIRKPTA